MDISRVVDDPGQVIRCVIIRIVWHRQHGIIAVVCGVFAQVQTTTAAVFGFRAFLKAAVCTRPCKVCQIGTCVAQPAFIPGLRVPSALAILTICVNIIVI